MLQLQRFAALPIALALAACATATKEAPPSAPASAAPVASAPGFKAMVSAANPLAVEAGVKVLREGGSAVDAAVAVQAVLSLVEPQSSGVGGGAFMTYYDARTKKVVAYNGRETAPAGATETMFLDASGKPLPYPVAVTSGKATGVPGAVAMLAMAQAQHGKLPWKDLFSDAERLAADGFVVSPRLAGMIAGPFPQTGTPDAKAYFTKPDGQRYQAGDVLKNPAYAQTVRKIAAEGPKALLEGSIAEAIVAKVHEGPLPGTITLSDLKSYKPKVDDAVCRPYRVYVVCVPNPPSSGAALLQALGILSHTDIADRGPTDPQAWFLFAQASRLMYADRDRYFGDPDFTPVPLEGLLEDSYVAKRATLIGDVAGPAPGPGTPRGAGALAPDATKEPGGTSHFVVVDADGNVVSMTTTVESIFGTGRMVGGFFLNNQLTDFSWAPANADGTKAANAVAPGKRPRSSMAPTIVLDREGRFVAAIGSPGGNSILAYNLKALVGILDWELSVQDAFNLPNLIARGDNIASEPARYAPGVVDALAAKGVAFKGSGGEGSGLHGVMMTPQGLQGGADERREGVAKGF
ncbi:gamma-glutamyltransferase [Phenylobacterium sp. Root77]|uniref:gamma-glutamyltransferase n=1 Tax=unclassified Phenylobacterium TaxID=2640670 RepID=UPI0006FF50E6|nr:MULTISPECIES: gamma-glutamyltransferase [unclassified Phenylobacterium]KQW71149.1 gamma-glutamyltransferase [Phenylobacterium sp. Root1277]KQW91284.1 gamma-glutamyltransferase [Phenylobacterium sp. Root1290]KRC39777.1 gamma-glutamyltransferase [Phenylobacterium sp. Root77]